MILSENPLAPFLGFSEVFHNTYSQTRFSKDPQKETVIGIVDGFLQSVSRKINGQSNSVIYETQLIQDLELNSLQVDTKFQELLTPLSGYVQPVRTTSKNTSEVQSVIGLINQIMSHTDNLPFVTTESIGSIFKNRNSTYIIFTTYEHDDGTAAEAFSKTDRIRLHVLTNPKNEKSPSISRPVSPELRQATEPNQARNALGVTAGGASHTNIQTPTELSWNVASDENPHHLNLQELLSRVTEMFNHRTELPPESRPGVVRIYNAVRDVSEKVAAGPRSPATILIQDRDLPTVSKLLSRLFGPDAGDLAEAPDPDRTRIMDHLMTAAENHPGMTDLKFNGRTVLQVDINSVRMTPVAGLFITGGRYMDDSRNKYQLSAFTYFPQKPDGH